MNISDYLIKLMLFLLVGFQLSGKKNEKVQKCFSIDVKSNFYKLCNIQKSPEGESKVERVNYSATNIHKTDKNVDVFVTVKGFVSVRCLLPDRHN